MTTESKKSAARGAKLDPREAGARGTALPGGSKRPSVPGGNSENSGAAIAKKREKPAEPAVSAVPTVVPVAASPVQAAATAANDNNDDEKSRRPTVSPPRRGLPTGSLHAEAREPAQAESLKQRLTSLMTAQQRLADLKRSANKHFYEIGEVLKRVRDDRLFEVKGYSSFEAFIEREVALGVQFCVQAVRVYETFLPQAAHAYGLARLSSALRALEDEPSGVQSLDHLHATRSAIPPHKL